MASFHNWTGDEEIDTQVPQFLNEDNTATQEKLDTKLGKNDTAAAAIKDGAGNTISTTYASKADVSALLSTKLGVTATAYAATRDGAGNNIVNTYAKKTDISGMVKSVNGKAPDAGGNVNVANMTGASDSAAGKAGLVPAPVAGMQNKFLCSDATWKDAGGLPVGHEFFTTNPNIPAGCIPLLGGEYSRTAYADLWAWVQTQSGYLLEESAWQAKAAANSGNVPFYSKGNGSTTFRVPAFKCWVRGASSISEVSEYLAAGLPNITGSTAWAVNGTLDIYSTQDTPYHQNTGALSVKKDGKAYGAIGDTGKDSAKSNVSVNIDASLSNPIYGSSDTVQPSSIVGLWCVKAYGTVTNVGSTDVSNIAQGLANAETRISVLNTLVGAENNGGIVAALLEQNGYVKFSNGLILQWGVYTIGTRNVTITLPIATSVTYAVIAVARTENNYGCSGSQNCQYVSNVTNKTFQAGSYDTGNGYAGFWWLSIGKA